MKPAGAPTGIGRLHTISDVGGLDRALPVLERGFPTRSRDFWQAGFRTIERLQRKGYCEAPFGYVLGGPGGDAGVMLTFRSRRREAARERHVCNLSSWYLDPELRWYAPIMLRQVIKRENGNEITDLTASDTVADVNASLGFSVSSDGWILANSLPWVVLPQRGGLSVSPFDARTSTSLDSDQRDMVEAHLGLGCLVGVLTNAREVSPIVIRVVRRRRLNVAEVVFTSCRLSLLKALPSLMRFLARHGLAFAAIDGTRAICPPGALFRPGQRRFLRGAAMDARIDYAFSELVVLGV